MLTKDVVCGMQVEQGSNALEYLGVSHSFCSQQCRERFQANPHLYVGVPGQEAPKHAGLEVIQRRRLRLAQPLSASQSQMLTDALRSMMGVQSVVIEGDCVTIVYDLLQATAEQLEQKLVDTGTQLGEGWVERLRRAFTHYEEDCKIGNLEVRESRHLHRH